MSLNKPFQFTSFAKTATKEERNERYYERLTIEEIKDFVSLKRIDISEVEFLRVLDYLEKAGIIEVLF